MKSTLHTTLSLSLLSLFALAACGEADHADDPPGVFIALQRDFAPLESWERFTLSGDVAGHPVGPRHIYRNRRPPDGAARYPVGTMLVKVVETSADIQFWEIFGMVKRGGDFNYEAARDWEFFLLRFDAKRTPVITDRGSRPTGDAMHMYNTPQVGNETCNVCHGTAGSAATDHVLDPQLRPPGA